MLLALHKASHLNVRLFLRDTARGYSRSSLGQKISLPRIIKSGTLPDLLPSHLHSSRKRTSGMQIIQLTSEPRGAW